MENKVNEVSENKAVLTEKLFKMSRCIRHNKL